MTFYILYSQLTNLFVSLHLLTTLTFDSEITYYLYGGSKEELFIQTTNQNRTLAIKGLKAGINSNLLVITRDRKFYFNVTGDESHPHQFAEVKEGIINHALKDLVETDDYLIREGASSILFINKKKRSVMVNGIGVTSREYFSKGVPLILDGRRILN